MLAKDADRALRLRCRSDPTCTSACRAVSRLDWNVSRSMASMSRSRRRNKCTRLRARARIGRLGKCLRTSAAVLIDASTSSIASTNSFASRGARGLEQLEPRRVAVVHLVAEPAHEVDLLVILLDGGERDAGHAQHARHDLAVAPVARDDHRVAGPSIVSNSGSPCRSFQRVEHPLVREERERRDQHRQRHGEHEELRGGSRRGWPRLRGGEQHEGELAALREPHGERAARRRSQSRVRARCRRSAPLSRRCMPSAAPSTASGMRREQREVRAHPDRDEEEAEQQALERLDVGFELVPELGVGEQHAGEERARATSTGRWPPSRARRR